MTQRVGNAKPKPGYERTLVAVHEMPSAPISLCRICPQDCGDARFDQVGWQPDREVCRCWPAAHERYYAGFAP